MLGLNSNISSVNLINHIIDCAPLCRKGRLNRAQLDDISPYYIDYKLDVYKSHMSSNFRSDAKQR
jgi:hypothetical protein